VKTVKAKVLGWLRGKEWRGMNMCSVCGQRPPDIGTMCNQCAGR